MADRAIAGFGKPRIASTMMATGEAHTVVLAVASGVNSNITPPL